MPNARTRRSIAIGSTTIVPTSIVRATAARAGARSRTEFPTVRSSTSYARIRAGAACSMPEPNAASTSRSTTAPLAAAAAQSSGDVDSRHRGARRRSRDRDARPRVLGAGRRRAAASESRMRSRPAATISSRRATAYRVRPGNQEGTPLPLDEPQVDNPPDGLYIDYYLARRAAHAGRHRDSRRMTAASCAGGRARQPPNRRPEDRAVYAALDRDASGAVRSGPARTASSGTSTDEFHGPLVAARHVHDAPEREREDARRERRRVAARPANPRNGRRPARAVRTCAPHRGLARRRRGRASASAQRLERQALGGTRAPRCGARSSAKCRPTIPTIGRRLLARLHELPLPGERARLSRERGGKRRRRADARHAYRLRANSRRS